MASTKEKEPIVQKPRNRGAKKTEAQASPLTELAQIPVGLIFPGKNVRTVFENIESLAETIKDEGILKPLIVRPEKFLVTSGGKREEIDGYELIDGERRFRAAQLAGLKTVPCVIRTTQSDAHIRKIMLILATQHENLHALDIMLALQDEIAELVQGGMSEVEATKQASLSVGGKAQAWGYSHLQLRKLSPKCMAAFRAGQFDQTKAVALARVSHEVQDHLLEKIVEQDWSSRTLIQQIKQLTPSLAMAPFDIASAELLPMAGPCTTCPKNSACEKNASLLPSMGEEFDNAPKGKCTDPECFNAKRQAHAEVVLRQQAQTPPPPPPTPAQPGANHPIAQRPAPPAANLSAPTKPAEPAPSFEIPGIVEESKAPEPHKFVDLDNKEIDLAQVERGNAVQTEFCGFIYDELLCNWNPEAPTLLRIALSALLTYLPGAHLQLMCEELDIDGTNQAREWDNVAALSALKDHVLRAEEKELGKWAFLASVAYQLCNPLDHYAQTRGSVLAAARLHGIDAIALRKSLIEKHSPEEPEPKGAAQDDGSRITPPEESQQPSSGATAPQEEIDVFADEEAGEDSGSSQKDDSGQEESPASSEDYDPYLDPTSPFFGKERPIEETIEEATPVILDALQTLADQADKPSLKKSSDLVAGELFSWTATSEINTFERHNGTGFYYANERATGLFKEFSGGEKSMLVYPRSQTAEPLSPAPVADDLKFADMTKGATDVSRFRSESGIAFVMQLSGELMAIYQIESEYRSGQFIGAPEGASPIKLLSGEHMAKLVHTDSAKNGDVAFQKMEAWLEQYDRAK